LIAAHPWESAAIAAGAAVIIGGVIYLISKSHQQKQEAPTPGLVPVPVA
jgi:cell division protein FtsN